MKCALRTSRTEAKRQKLKKVEYRENCCLLFQGICMEVEGSRFQGAAADLRKLRDHAEDENGEEEEEESLDDLPDLDDGPVANAFFAVEFSADEGKNSSDGKGEEEKETREIVENKSGEEGKKGAAKELESVLKIEEREGPNSRNGTSAKSDEEKPLNDEHDDGKKTLEERVLFQSDDSK
jgi:hypothetical protein